MTEKTWSYKNYEVKEGLKPGSKHFSVFLHGPGKGQEEVQLYCVWIDDANLGHFSPTKEFEKIISSRVRMEHVG